MDSSENDRSTSRETRIFFNGRVLHTRHISRVTKVVKSCPVLGDDRMKFKKRSKLGNQYAVALELYS